MVAAIIQRVVRVRFTLCWDDMSAVRVKRQHRDPISRLAAEGRAGEAQKGAPAHGGVQAWMKLKVKSASGWSKLAAEFITHSRWGQ